MHVEQKLHDFTITVKQIHVMYEYLEVDFCDHMQTKRNEFFALFLAHLNWTLK
jgi:hypothetical protein